MSPGEWFVFWTVGLGIVGLAIGRHPVAFLGGALAGLFMWCLGGIWYVASIGVDCPEYDGAYYGDIPEKCQ